MTPPMTVARDAALAAHAAGLCVVPPTGPGHGKSPKAPLGRWEQYQTARPTPEQIERWYATGRTGIGIVCGAVSGNLEAFDVEGRAVVEGTFDAFVDELDRAGLGELWDRLILGYSEKTPTDGVHVLWRCAEIGGNTKLARRPATPDELAANPDQKVIDLIETRGERGYVVVAPSTGIHPNGRPWTLVRGGFDTIQTITPEERAAILDVARRFNVVADHPEPAPPKPRAAPVTVSMPVDGDMPSEEFNRAHTADEVLERAGFTFHSVGRDSRLGGEARNYTRPGKRRSEGSSATVWADGRATIFSSSVDVPAEVDDRRRLTPWQLHVHLNHRGDFTEAAREWRRQHPRPASATHTTTPPPPQAAAVDDDEIEAFWTSRPELEHVRAFALARRCSPWATLGVVLARIVAGIKPTVVLPAIIGSEQSLNLFIGLVGPSGGGKGATIGAGTAAVEIGLLSGVKTHTLGSGHGIPHAFAHREKGELIRDADRALFLVEEVDHLAGLSGQTGSTLLPEMRRVYSGERLGHLFVDPSKRIELEPHSYRACLLVGIQPKRAGVLLDDADGGTPQRFVWLPTVYPHPDEKPEEPAPWRWKPPTLRGGRHVLDVCDTAVHEIDRAHLARSRGEGDPLDGHRLLCREKVAAGLALLNGRAEIGEDDWRLSGVLMAVSDATRAAVVHELSLAAHERNEARAKAEAHRAAIVADELEQAATRRVASRILAHLHGGEWVPHGELRRRLRSTDRARFEDVVAMLVATGQVECEDFEYHGKGSRRYRLANTTPRGGQVDVVHPSADRPPPTTSQNPRSERNGPFAYAREGARGVDTCPPVHPSNDSPSSTEEDAA